MNNPRISIDRGAKSFAIFDGFDIVGEFEPYRDEVEVMALARARIAKLTDKKPEVVYPSITKMVVSRGRSKCRAFTWIEVLIVLVIIGLIAALAVPAYEKASKTLQKAEGSPEELEVSSHLSDRFTLKRMMRVIDYEADNGKRSIYILTDKQTGQEFVGVSGIGITELGHHKHGEDER